jgi:hypothetical protein
MEPVNAVVTEAWDAAVADWDNPARHDALLTLAAKHEAYGWTAKQYQARLKENAEDAVAQRQITRLRKAAELTLYATAAQRETKTKTPFKASIAMIMIMVFLIIAGLLVTYVLRGDKMKQRRPSASSPTVIDR